MARILTDLPPGLTTGKDVPSRAQQGPSEAISPGTKGLALGGPPKVLERPLGWMNSPAGRKYLTRRTEMFQSQTVSQMNYGFLPKNSKT